jgi:uncharacterized membrane protein YjjP (DUF1212 family)
MLNLIVKLIAGPVIMIVTDYLIDEITYPNLISPILVGLSVGLAAYGLDFLILRRKQLWISLGGDLITAVFLIYFFSNMFGGHPMTFIGSLITGILFTMVEYFLHRYLLSSGKVKKEYA